MKRHQLKQVSAQSSQSGFTIIESLVALVVVGLLLAAIAPVIVIATATRVQAKRVEQATEAAKGFIDAVSSKTISEANISNAVVLSASKDPKRVKDDYLLNTVLAPGDATTLYCFHKDGKITLPSACTSYKTTIPVQFYIQAFGNAVGTISASTTTAEIDKGKSYRLGIRVYRSDAQFGSLKRSFDNNGNQKTAATYSGGIGDRNAPLVEMTTEVVRGQPSYNDLCDRLGGCQP